MLRIALLIAFVAGLVVLARPDVLNLGLTLPTRADLAAWIDAAGVFGPIVVVALMAIAIVASPLPSAPIALAAGAAYGHWAGAALVVIGAELGALIAFALARKLGHPFVERYFGDTSRWALLGSQNMLTFIVFASRLLPFLSFDLISYAAGLSAIQTWRFALATLAGIIPASLFLAHMGAVAMTGNSESILWTVAILGVVSGLSLIAAIVSKKRKSGRLSEFT